MRAKIFCVKQLVLFLTAKHLPAAAAAEFSTRSAEFENNTGQAAAGAIMPPHITHPGYVMMSVNLASGQMKTHVGPVTSSVTPTSCWTF